MKRPPVRRPKDARRHARHSSIRRRSSVVIPSVAIVFFLGIGLFVMGVSWFRHESSTTTPSSSLNESVSDAHADQIQEPIPSSGESILADVTGGSSKGQVTRSVQDASFTYRVDATLPSPGEQYSYSVWLVRPLPYDFLTLGSLVEKEPGHFFLDWKGEEKKDYAGYIRIVVTREKFDEKTTPGEHVLKGEF